MRTWHRRPLSFLILLVAPPEFGRNSAQPAPPPGNWT